MRVAHPPAGSSSDDSDGDAGAWPVAASTSRRRDASDDADDLRQMLDAAEAARAALREVASSAAAEREMAFEARDAANAERDRLLSELEPLRLSLAKATRALAQRDDETRSLRFKLEQLLSHARERDRVTTSLRPKRDPQSYEEEETVEEEERVYVEALATISASLELELAETRGALRDARDEVEEFSSTDKQLRREVNVLNEEVLLLKTKLERSEALRETLRRTHVSEMSASTRRAEAAEAEARLLVRENSFARKAKDKETLERFPSASETRATPGDLLVDPRRVSEEDKRVSRDVENVVSAAHEKSSIISESRKEEPKERSPRIESKNDSSHSTAHAYEALDAHRRSIKAHLDALQRDRETLATTKLPSA